MWDKMFMLFLMGLFYLFWKVTQKEHSKQKFHIKFLLFYIYSSACAFFVWPFFLFNPKSVHNARFGAWLIKPITRFYEIEWDLRNGKVLAEDRGAVIVANHQSSLDILGMFNIWHVAYKMTAIAKSEVFYVWPFGLSAYLAGVVFINRSDAKNAYKKLEITSKVMVNEKTKIWVFPEGTRNKDYTKLLPFKRGAFAMAVAAQVPVIPVVFSPYYFINKNKYIFDKGQVVVQCLDPISTEGLTSEDVPDLINRVHENMSAAYREIAKEVIDKLPAKYPFTLKG
ncbi:1-acyl-sn-glycerol-3-phosphate acyltransferase beta-like [Ostrinia furnacalis]|uniref:1-acyl-sn-glycerol-3-phosphate acyltransferase beta-like n=1 Tax=Ostrinia furnacalis TaxID=93504 RepID=UPI00103DB288|nr:1-acyl-sn-glycerol-3-phosphate acyltransferase beta-like [Ostrinia furnacalis]